MRRFFVCLAVFTVLVFMISCGGSSSEQPKNDDDQTEISDEDSEDADVSDAEISDEDSGDTEEPDNNDTDTGEPENKQGELYGKCYPNKTCNDGLVCDEEHDICIKDNEKSDEDKEEPDDIADIDNIEISDEDPDTDTPGNPDNDTETPVNPEAAENHKISGIFQVGTGVSGIEAALYECGGTDKIAAAITDAKGNFSFNADISASKTYCVKAGDFASCFKGKSDHTANISEITNAVLLIDPDCSNLRQSETKIRTYAKLGTGEWLGELDYSKLSGIKEGLKLFSNYLKTTNNKTLSEKIAEDAKKESPEFANLFNGFRVSANKTEIVLGETTDNSTTFSTEGGSTKVAPNFKITWTMKNKNAEAATYKFTTSTPGEYVARAKLVSKTRRTGVFDVNVYDDENRLLAHSLMTGFITEKPLFDD